MASLTIKLTRVDRTYRPGDVVSGVVIVDNPQSTLAHNGLVLRALGRVIPQSEGSSSLAGFTSSSAGETLLSCSIDVTSAGKFAPGSAVEIPFEFNLSPLSGKALSETYKGVFLSVRYSISATLKVSGMLAKPLDADDVELLVEVPSTSRPPARLQDFELTPALLENVKKVTQGSIPKFVIKGRLTSLSCSLSSPFTGEVTVLEADSRLKSLELQLVRVESVGAGASAVKESTEIQRLQIADGDPPRGLAMPLWQLFPKSFTCPSVQSPTFSVQFEVNVIVIFEDGPYTATVNFPVQLYR